MLFVALPIAVFATVAIFLPESKAKTVDEAIATASGNGLVAPHDESVEFYVTSATSMDEARQLVANDERMQEISDEQASSPEVTMSDDYDIGHEIAWLAVQMAGVASDLDSSLYAPGANPWKQIDDPRLSNLFAVMDAESEICPAFNCAYGSCNQAACGVIAAVADMDMLPFEAASGGPSNMQSYLRGHPDLYERVYPDTDEDLHPGDIFVTTDKFTHTAIYVGNALVREKFPDSSGNLYQAGYQEGHHARYAQIDKIDIGGVKWAGYEVYRVRHRNDGSQYPYLDYRSIVQGG